MAAAAYVVPTHHTPAVRRQIETSHCRNIPFSEITHEAYMLHHPQSPTHTDIWLHPPPYSPVPFGTGRMSSTQGGQARVSTGGALDHPRWILDPDREGREGRAGRGGHHGTIARGSDVSRVQQSMPLLCATSTCTSHDGTGHFTSDLRSSDKYISVN
jgi:hypothetical protein